MGELRGCRPRVLWFQWRAMRVARRTNDLFSIVSVTRPGDTRVLLELAEGRRRIVELGTATAWTAITLALDDPERHVVTYDPIRRPEAEAYLALVGRDIRRRIDFVVASGSIGPRDGRPVELLYIDSTHGREATIQEMSVWRPHLSDGALVLFDDYTNPDFPGVREAVQQLGLEGVRRGKLFIYEHRFGFDSHSQ